MLVLPSITINTPAGAPQPMASIQISQLDNKHCTLGILNWFLGYSTMGLLQHFSNSILHWQELMYQSNTENSKPWLFRKSQAPNSRCTNTTRLFRGQHPSFTLSLGKYWLASTQSSVGATFPSPSSEWFTSKLSPLTIKQPVTYTLKVTNNVSALTTKPECLNFITTAPFIQRYKH